MMRRHGKLLDGCETYGRAPGVDGAQYDPRPNRLDQGRGTQFARGSTNHPDGSFDLFTGG